MGNSIVTENHLVLDKAAGQSSQEVRHIVLRGSNREIGSAMATLGAEHYQSGCLEFASLQEKQVRERYIREQYPALAERMAGVAVANGWGDDDLHDSSSLWYDIKPVSCSAVYFPKTVTASGHSFQARNMDFYTVDMFELMHPGSKGSGNRLFSRNYILEMYPRDGGYASLVVGTFDLMSGAYDGFNEHGLCVSGLVDQNLAKKTVPMSELGSQEGLNYLQMVRAVLEGARTVDEARSLVSKFKVYFPMDGMHFLIGDRDGDSMILEFSEDDLSPRCITPTVPGPAVMTNHSAFYFPSIETFAPIDRSKPYDTFYRYERLRDFLRASAFHKYTPDDGLYAMSMVYGFANDESEGAAMPLPLRTVWSLVMDLEELSLKIRFYTKDDEALGAPHFSDDYTFRLQG